MRGTATWHNCFSSTEACLKFVADGEVQGAQFLVALLRDNAARRPSPKGCCYNQSLPFPSANLMHRRNGSTARRGATLSAGKRSASASYQGWQLTVAQWLDFSDNLLFVPLAYRHLCNLAPCMTNQRDVTRGELKSLPTDCTTYQINIDTSSLHSCVKQQRSVPLLTPWRCGEVVQ